MALIGEIRDTTLLGNSKAIMQVVNVNMLIKRKFQKLKAKIYFKATIIRYLPHDKNIYFLFSDRSNYLGH